MIEFDLSLEILAEVFDKKVPFADALKNKFFSNPTLRPYRGVVAGLTGCEIRHHLLFTYLLKDNELLEENDRRAVSLALANDYFFHRFTQEEFDEELLHRIGEEKKASVQALLDNASNPDEFVPLTVKRVSPLYLSLRYNIPDWALRIFRHFPRLPILKTLKRFGRPATNSVRVKEEVSDTDLIATGEFEASSTPKILTYVGKTALRKTEAFRAFQIFPEKELTKIILSEHKVSEPSEILLYNGNADSSLERELIESYGSSVGMNLATPNIDEKIEVTKTIKEKGLHNVSFFSAPDPLSMDAAVSRQQDLVIAAPKSTGFDAVPTAPDYLLNYNRDEMDAIIEQEKNVLEGAAKYVEVGGKLLYLIYTISQKESSTTISNFLKAHPEFELVSEKQYYPYEFHQTAAYLAVLTKTEKELTIAPPLGNIPSISNAASIASSAASK